MSNNSEIRLMANEDFISIGLGEVNSVPSDYGMLYYAEEQDTAAPWWEQGVLVSYEDIIAAERGEFDDYEW